MLKISEAKALDHQDSLKEFREKFHIPSKNEQPLIYFCGNSLGLQPKSAGLYINEVLTQWQEKGVEGHFSGSKPWVNYHNHLTPMLAQLTGARHHEVVAMNTLTTNLHLLLTSFYRPNNQRHKILIEDQAFSSDQYAIKSQIRLHGFAPETSLLTLKPRNGEYLIREEDVINEINQNKASLALVFLGGVQYYSGQFFDIETITHAAHQSGAFAGFDLAHAIGNVPLQLHHWDVDFAVWCSYKYLNSGPGNNGGLYVHERFAERPDLPRMAGWWGYPEQQRFLMKKDFYPAYGAEGWQLSNENVIAMAAQLAALELFEEAGLKPIFEKSREMTSLLSKCIQETDPREEFFSLISPGNPEKRGCQLSLLSHKKGKKIFNFLDQKGVVIDWREPDVMRIAPVPLYNTFEEIYFFDKYLKEAMELFG